jgi:hypothetical protein
MPGFPARLPLLVPQENTEGASTPQQGEWTGKGDPAVAANWTCSAVPAKSTNESVE